MQTRLSQSSRSSTLLLTVVMGLALNLRPALAAIGPLLDQIKAATGLTNTQASLLTTLPILMMGLCAFFGRQIQTWLGEARGISIGTALITLSCVLRYVMTDTLGLILTSVAAGIGIAIVQILLPACIKRGFGKDSGRAMGMFTTGIMAGAAVAAAAVNSLSGWLGWQGALAFWALPALVSLLMWMQAVRQLDTAPAGQAKTQQVTVSFWGRLRAWELAVLFGIGTGAYTLVLAWLPPFYTELGWSPSESGFLLSGLTVGEVAAGVLVSALVSRFPDRRKPITLTIIMLLAGLLCLIFEPLKLALVACALLGMGIGGLFSLTMILTLDHLDDPTRAGELTSFVQGGGYVIASFMPLLAGLLRDYFSDLTQAWVVMAVAAGFLLVLAQRFSPASYAQLNQP